MAKICMVISEDHTGHPIVRRQIPMLLGAGHSVSVLDPCCDASEIRTPGYSYLRVRPVSLRFLGKAVWVLLRRFNERLFGEPWWTTIWFAQLLLTAGRCARYALSEKADYYHAHDLQSLLPAIMVGKLLRRPVIYDAHELQSEQGNPSALPNRVMRGLEAFLIPLVDQLVVPNESRARVYMSRCSLRNEPTVVLNCPPTAEVPRTSTVRDRAGLPPCTRVVLYHGTFMPGRALEELIRAARDFEANTALVMIGRQNAFCEDVLKPLWRSHNLAGRVVFLPFVVPEEVMHYVASADLGIVIYRNTNLNNYLCAPTKLYEYLMARVPVAVCDFPEMRSLMQEYPVGVSFDPDSPESIASAVNHFFSLPPQRHAEIRSCIASARARFNWETEGQKLLGLFRDQSPAGERQRSEPTSVPEVVARKRVSTARR